MRTTLIFFSTASRLQETLIDIFETFGERKAVIARELTKRHEEVIRDKLSVLSHTLQSRRLIKGEFVVMVSPPLEKEVVTDEQIIAELSNFLPETSFHEGVRIVSATLGVRKSRVYRLGLKQARND